MGERWNARRAVRFAAGGMVVLLGLLVDEIAAERLAAKPRDPLQSWASRGADSGAYLATVSGCTYCHRSSLGGRQEPIGPPGRPLVPAITREALAGWTHEDFTRLLRLGRRPDGRERHHFMPSRQYAWMTDAEIAALWTFIQGGPVPVGTE